MRCPGSSVGTGSKAFTSKTVTTVTTSADGTVTTTTEVYGPNGQIKEKTVDVHKTTPPVEKKKPKGPSAPLLKDVPVINRKVKELEKEIEKVIETIEKEGDGKSEVY